MHYSLVVLIPSFELITLDIQNKPYPTRVPKVLTSRSSNWNAPLWSASCIVSIRSEMARPVRIVFGQLSFSFENWGSMNPIGTNSIRFMREVCVPGSYLKLTKDLIR